MIILQDIFLFIYPQIFLFQHKDGHNYPHYVSLHIINFRQLDKINPTSTCQKFISAKQSRVLHHFCTLSHAIPSHLTLVKLHTPNHLKSHTFYSSFIEPSSLS